MYRWIRPKVSINLQDYTESIVNIVGSFSMCQILDCFRDTNSFAVEVGVELSAYNKLILADQFIIPV